MRLISEHLQHEILCPDMTKKLAQIMGIFLYNGPNMCIVPSTESSHGDGFFEFSQLTIFVAIEGKLALELNFF